jgi:glycosyltransferase involved in cell wall biosynthesis
VLEEHAFFHGKQWFYRTEMKKRELKSLTLATSLVVYSNAVKKYVENKCNRQLPVFIHQNVDYTRFDFVNERENSVDVKIGFIGSFLKWHRVDLLIKAFIRLKEEGHQVKLFLIGNGMEYGSIKKMVLNSDFANDIFMPGFLDGQELLNLKQKLDIGVMPGSNWYGAPNKIFEYGAAKIAVVAPDTPTICDLFEHDKELLFFKQDDAESLLNQLRCYVTQVDLRKEHAKALQNKIRNNYSENVTFTFYNQLLSSE